MIISRASVVRGLALAAALLAAERADAAPPEAQRLFDEGRALLREGRVEQAAVRFRESLAVLPTVGASLNLGDCEVRLGRLATAYRQFETAASLAERADPERVAEARDRLKMLLPRVAFIVLKSAGAPPVSLSVDGEPVPPGTSRWAVDSGSHVVVARCADGGGDRAVVAVETTATRTLCEPGRPREAAETAPVAERSETGQTGQTGATSQTSRSSALTTVGWTAAGVGGAAVVTGIVLGAVALSKKSSASSDCPSYPRCAPADLPRAQSDYDGASGFASVSTVTLAVGAGLLAGGVLLLVLTRGRDASVASALDRSLDVRLGSW